VVTVDDQVLDHQVQVGEGRQPSSQRLPGGRQADGPARRMLDHIVNQELLGSSRRLVEIPLRPIRACSRSPNLKSLLLRSSTPIACMS
jgi:hypothetical protein